MFPEATKILIVDDSSFARTMLRNGLRDIGFHQILEASTASEAQMTLLSPEHESPPIGLIISDIHMPGMTGLELLRWVRQQPAFKGIALLLLTSSPRHERDSRGRTGGRQPLFAEAFGRECPEGPHAARLEETRRSVLQSPRREVNRLKPNQI